MSAAIDLMREAARRHRQNLDLGADIVSFPDGSTAIAGAETASITAAGNTVTFDTRDSLDLALFVVRLDEAICRARRADTGDGRRRLRDALWAVEFIAVPLSAAGWRKIETAAGCIAAAWDVEMVDPPVSASSRTVLRMTVVPAIERFRNGGALFAYLLPGGGTTALAALFPSSPARYWSAPSAGNHFLEMLSRLPR